MTTPVRVRIAPSPTGTIHLGLARTALFNWAFARGRGGTFVLRIEDTDRERSSAVSERGILEGLGWLGLDWDEGPDVGGPHGPYRQSERIESHRAAADRLLEGGPAYRCFCTPKRLDELRTEQQAAKRTPAYDRHCHGLSPQESARRAEAGEPFVVRFFVPEGPIVIDDLVRGRVEFAGSEVDDWIMLRRDGNPTYNFVVVVDDAAMQITHVLRGEEHLVNTPKQVLLYQALGFQPPQFAHLPLMLGADKKKLSKRAGDVSLGDYRSKGYPREAIANFLALQGWALDGETEVFSMQQLVEKFEPSQVSKGGSVFDLDKFQWLAGEYLHAEPVERLAEHCAPFVVEAGQATPAQLEKNRDWFLAVVAQERERIRLYSELPERLAHWFADDDAVPYQPKAEKNARKREDGLKVLSAWRDWLFERGGFGSAAELAADTRAWLEEQGQPLPTLFQPLRCVLTGLPGGPDLFETILLLGPERTRSRVEAGIARLS